MSFPLTEFLALFLTSREGRALINAASELPGDAPARVLALRKRGIEGPVAAGVVEVWEARRRARVRFADADHLFFTGEMLAQATSPVLAAYHADCLATFTATVADLGCGAGIDAIAMARRGLRVIAIDRDPGRLVFARANAAASGIPESQIEFVVGDVTALRWEADAVFWDPARRISEGSQAAQRVSRHAERYEPPLGFLEAIRARVRGGCIKLSPALPDEVLAELNGSVAFLSEERTCKEACVRFGLASGAADAVDAAWTAALLPEGISLTGAPASEFSGCGGADGKIAPEACAFVFDPDPAIVRAGALGVAADWLGACRLSGADAYLTGDTLPSLATAGRMASVYRVAEAMPYRPRVVGAWLRARGIDRLVVKKRHFDREPDAVLRELGLKGRGGDEATLILVRRDGGGAKEGHLAVICEPVTLTHANL